MRRTRIGPDRLRAYAWWGARRQTEPAQVFAWQTILWMASSLQRPRPLPTLTQPLPPFQAAGY